jgi:hypothetical protein
MKRTISKDIAVPADGERVCIVLDGRLGLELDEEEACAVIPFIANCIETALRH